MTPITHPYMQQTLLPTLVNHYTLCELLNKRVVLSKENYSTKTEYERNEIEILNLETLARIQAMRQVITGREEYFKKYIQKFAVDAEEAEKNFENTVVLAKNKQGRIPGMPELLKAINWDVARADIEAKIKLYERLKGMLA